MFKHLMARLLILILILTMIFIPCSVSAAATPTSGVDEENQINNEQNVSNQEETIIDNEIVPLSQLFNIENLIPKPEYKIGYTKTQVNVRKNPNKKSKVLTVFYFNKKVKYCKYNKKWVQIKYKKNIAYIYKKYISKKKNKYIDYSVPNYTGYKSWMPYTAITASGSPQYKVQHEYAYTGNYGIRMVKDRYCVAIGSYFNTHIGQFFDLILANGTVIKCIKGDEKANQDTDSANIFSRNGCCSEFLIDRGSLASSIRTSGDTSSACKDWQSKVVKIRVYKRKLF